MRRYVRALVLCTVLVLLSVLYVLSELHANRANTTPLLRFSSSSFSSSHTNNNNDNRPQTKPPHTADRSRGDGRNAAPKADSAGRREEAIHLAVVACGTRQDEAVSLLKSAVILSNRAMRFHLFAEDQLHSSIKAVLDSWPASVRQKFSYTVYPVSFPSQDQSEWSKLFKPCASQRLFLPMILKEVDSLLYVDTDVLFLRPVELLWDLFMQFNSSQLAAMAPEHEEPRIAWYNRFARHPYYGQTGINSGVMLMNLTRMRRAHFKNDMTTVGLRWEELLVPLLNKYKLNITWGDQDLINIIFHHNPEKLLVFPCHWNYRPDHCIYGSNCIHAEQEGVFVLHGNRGVFHTEKQPAFKAVYDSVREYSFGEDLVTSFWLPLEDKLNETTHTYCGKISHLFTRALNQSAGFTLRTTLLND
ncbi:glucoside xylosyltransferase 1-like [Astyanax mexicanus]|uniref:Glucoside xylosyltransferase 1 n=1 Tax=Astyanax mexicanus TaxID=7994 RepID=A0A8B9L7E3_ASTMX|nr:glucoside xylosyltransferase 1-like [Astyanax mexicanus]